MELEVDFLPVGEGTKAGDAIVLRYGNLNGSREDYSVVIIDAGYSETGQKIVEHIKNVYKTNIVICYLLFYIVQICNGPVLDLQQPQGYID